MIYIYLMGGLGNQLFQYAFAKNLSIKLNRKLIVDSKIELFKISFDKRNNVIPYKNRVNLLPLTDIKIRNNIFFILFFFIFRVFFKIFKKKLFNTTFFLEQDLSINDFMKLVELKSKNNKNLFFQGYWQSEKYFINSKKQIFDEIKINIPKENKYLDMSKLIC